jgi:type I restriction enzyme S subunit
MSLNLDKSAWKRVTFGGVVRNVNVPVRDAAAAGIDRVIAMEHLDPGELEIKRWGSLEAGTTFTRRVRPGQTLFGKRRAYQRKVAYAEFGGICSSDILTFEAVETQLLPKFLPFLVQSNEFFDHALGTSAGSLSPRTNWRDLSTFEFNLPPLSLQQGIADLLWAIEREREAQVGLIFRLREVEAAWVRGVGSQSSAHAALGEVLETVLDRRGITPKKLGGEFVGDGVPVLSAMNIVEGGINRDRQERYVSTEVARRWMSGWLRAGDILMTSEAPLGSTVLLKEDMQACIGQRLFALRPNTQRIMPEYLFAWLNSSAGRAALDVRASGTTVKGIRQSELVKIELPLPDVPTQREFLAKWNAVQSSISLVTGRLSVATTLRKSLVNEIFGE